MLLHHVSCSGHCVLFRALGLVVLFAVLSMSWALCNTHSVLLAASMSCRLSVVYPVPTLTKQLRVCGLHSPYSHKKLGHYVISRITCNMRNADLHVPSHAFWVCVMSGWRCIIAVHGKAVLDRVTPDRVVLDRADV